MYNHNNEYSHSRPRKRRNGGTVVLLVMIGVFFSTIAGIAGGITAATIMQSRTPAESALPEILRYEPAESAAETFAEQYAEIATLEEYGENLYAQPLANKTPQLTSVEVASMVAPSVVEIKTETITSGGRFGTRIGEGAGSGVIISTDGYIITNNHVIENANSIFVRLYNGREHEAVLVGRDPQTDLAVLKIDAQGLTPAVFGNSADVRVAESVLAVGNPLGALGGTVTYGIISALDREIIIEGQAMSLLQMDAAVNPGNSGGGLFNMSGELIGIVNAKSGGLNIEGLGFAIPVNTVQQVIGDILEHGFVRGRVDTGLILIDIQTPQAAMLHRVSQPGLYIAESVHEYFLPGDRILSVDGSPIANLESFNAKLYRYNVGDKISITVARGEQTVTHEITLAELRTL